MPFGFNETPSAVSSSDTQVKSIVTAPVGATHDDGKAPGGGSAIPAIHKSILGMLDELPPPKTKWNKSEQADWLDAMATLFQVIYKSEDRGEISVAFNASMPF